MVSQVPGIGTGVLEPAVEAAVRDLELSGLPPRLARRLCRYLSGGQRLYTGGYSGIGAASVYLVATVFAMRASRRGVAAHIAPIPTTLRTGDRQG